jgi:hypothetical protein
LHPFEGLREYTRALNAVKLERVFAKPFVGNLDGHQDGVSCLGKHPQHLSLLVSGSYDGEVLFISSINSGVSMERCLKWKNVILCMYQNRFVYGIYHNGNAYVIFGHTMVM